MAYSLNWTSMYTFLLDMRIDIVWDSLYWLSSNTRNNHYYRQTHNTHLGCTTLSLDITYTESMYIPHTDHCIDKQ